MSFPKKLSVLCLLAWSWSSTLHGQLAEMDNHLTSVLNQSSSDTLIDVIVYFRAEGDLHALKEKFRSEGTPVDERPAAVMRLLKSTAKSSRPAFLEFIASSQMEYDDVRQFWIANAVALRAEPALIHAISHREDIARILLNRSIFAYGDPPIREGGSPKSMGGSEPGLVAVGAPELWAMGYTGQGRLAMTFDTGIWDDHPAFRDRYLGNLMPYTTTWFGYDSPVPMDKTSSHGTHVTGIMLGLDTATADTIGMAPRAYFIATDPVVSNLAFVKPLTDFMFGYEWALNPDGDENTSHDVPDVINNSWGFGPDLDEAPCPEFVIPVFTAVEAAGIANVFSAGNEGPGSESISVPHNTNIGLVNSFTVGAISSGAPYPIASFSSRGPSLCGGTGSILIKPEVSAPGISVRSSVGNDGYDLFSGTSMAAPHVSGAVLLLKEAFPYLSGEEILLALYYSATDLGEEGEDNTYGMGMINVKQAFDYLAETHEPVPPGASGVDLVLASILSPQMDLVSCVGTESHQFQPIITVYNNGAEAVDSVVVNYGMEDGPQSQLTVYETIEPNASLNITLPEMEDGTTGPRAFYVHIHPMENEFDVYNNHRIHRWINIPHYDWDVMGDFSENFDNGLDSSVWTVYNPDNWYTWDTLSVLQIDGITGVAAHINHYHYHIIAGQDDHLISPLIRNAPEESQVLSFDYFYRKREFNPFAMDTLIVTLTRVCGDSYPGEELFHEGGEDLFTVSQIQQNALPTEPGQWSTISLDLDLTEGDPFYFSFLTINRNGNHMLIDNVRIDNGTATEDRENHPRLSLFPNPGRNDVKIDWSGPPADLVVFDIAGRKVYAESRVEPGSTIHVGELSPGVYTVGIRWNGSAYTTEKLVIQ